MILYHSTFRDNIYSIKKLGLGARQPKNWDISESGVVCLTTNPYVAYSFCEAAEDVSESKYESGIIVLAVDSRVLNPAYVSKDNNLSMDADDCECYAYHSVIPSQFLFVVKSPDKVVGPLLSLKRVPAYE